MKPFHLIPAILIFGAAALAAAQESAPVQSAHVTARLVTENDGIAPDKPFTLGLQLEMEKGWHTYTDPAGDAGMPTKITWTLPEGFKAGEIQWPEARDFNLGPLKTRGYEDTVVLPVTITPPDALQPGQTVRIAAKVEWLACEVACVPGSADLALDLLVVSGAPPPRTGSANAVSGADSIGPSGVSGVFAAMFFAFVGGLILNLMPCVLPVLSLKVMGFMEQAGGDSRKARVQGLSFMAGVVGSFLLLASVLLLLRAGGEALGWGFQLQNPAIVAVLAFVFLLLALNPFGVFEIGVGLVSLGGATGRLSGHGRSFADGVLAAVVASPCTAPFMGTALGFSLSQPPAGALAIFGALGFGLATPYLVFVSWPGLLCRLPKPGVWMETFKMVLAFPLLGTVVWLTWVFGLQTGVNAMTALLAGLVLAALAAWIYGRWNLPHRSLSVRLGATAAGIILLATGVVISLPRNEASLPAQSVETGHDGWKPFTEERLEALLSEGRPVFVDFTAAWCVTCQWNKQNVLNSASVRKAFNEKGVAPLRADWTRQDPEIARFLERYGRHSVPLYLYFNGGSEPIVLPELLTRERVLSALNAQRVSRIQNELKTNEKPGGDSS
jgi:thiol:disulfide interchange protein